MKVNREVASIYHEVDRILTTADVHVEQYILEVPEEMAIPNISYSSPEITPVSHSLSAYKETAILFLTVFHSNTFEAMSLAELIVENICRNRNRITLVDSEGNVTDESLRLEDFPTTKKIEEGVAQIEINYPVYPEYIRQTGEEIKQYNFGINDRR